jgi:hypothetical protein
MPPRVKNTSANLGHSDCRTPRSTTAGRRVSPGGPGVTAVRRTEWFGGGPSRHRLGDARGVGGHTAKEATIRETVQGSYRNGGLAAWEAAEAKGPPVALRGPTVARGS